MALPGDDERLRKVVGIDGMSEDELLAVEQALMPTRETFASSASDEE